MKQRQCGLAAYAGVRLREDLERTVSLAECVDASVAVLLADFAVLIAASIIKVGIAVF